MRVFDRYIVVRFLRVYFFASVIFIAVYQVIGLFEKFDEWVAIKLPATTIINYYLNRLPEVFIVIGSLSVIMAVLFGLGRLVRDSEFTAIMAAGVSPYRVVILLLITTLFISFFNAFISEVIAPEARRRAEVIEKTRRGEVIPSVLINLFFHGESGNIFFIREFNKNTKTITGLEVLRFTQGGVLEWRVNAEEAVWQNNQWVLYLGFTREYINGNVATPSRSLRKLDITETPSDFLVGEKIPAELTFRDLITRIRVIKGSGFLPREELVEIHSRMSRPFSNLIVVLISIPFAIKAKQVGAAAGFGGALGLALIHLVLFNLGQLLGESVFPPVIGAWFANIIFIIIAGWLMKKAIK